MSETTIIHPKKYTRVTVKVGSNVLTRQDGTLDITRMSSLVDQIAALVKTGVEVILVSSGAIASGRSELSVQRHLDSVQERQLYSAVGQAKLINRYFEFFREHGLSCGQVLTTKESFATRRHYLNQRLCMTTMLENGVVPIINENDTVSVTELMFTDNDELCGLIASMMDCQALVILSNIDGIYDGQPGTSGAKVIPVITPEMDITSFISPSKSSFGRGGMLTKSSIARKVAEEGIEVIIANGKKEDILRDVLFSQSSTCTRFLPKESPLSGVKKWIAHSGSFAKGGVMVNSGAIEMLQSENVVSLLPIGITKIEGEFEKDDIIRILDESGQGIGMGKAAMSSQELQEVIGERGAKPAIHYDYLIID